MDHNCHEITAICMSSYMTVIHVTTSWWLIFKVMEWCSRCFEIEVVLWIFVISKTLLPLLIQWFYFKTKSDCPQCPRTREREEKIGGEGKMKTRDLKENWSSKKTDKSTHRWNTNYPSNNHLTRVLSDRSPKCLEMVDLKQCALTELNAFVTFVVNFGKKSGSISQTSF